MNFSFCINCHFLNNSGTIKNCFGYSKRQISQHRMPWSEAVGFGIRYAADELLIWMENANTDGKADGSNSILKNIEQGRI